MRKQTFLILFCMTVFSAYAQGEVSWNFLADFSKTGNPHGVWSYGWGVTEYDFDAYDLATNLGPDNASLWLEKEEDQNTGPQMWEKGGPTPEILQHPSPTEHCKVRWTVPPAIQEPLLLAEGKWGKGAGGARDLWIVKNGRDILWRKDDVVDDASFSIYLQKTDVTTLDFCQGSGKEWNSEATPFDVTITAFSQLSHQEIPFYLGCDTNQDNQIDKTDLELLKKKWEFYNQLAGKGYSAADIYQKIENARKEGWVKENFEKAPPAKLFSFRYDGKDSTELLNTWKLKNSTGNQDRKRTYHHIWTDEKTGLEVRCQAVEYTEFPAVEWTVYFKNTGSQDTPILENIQAINASFDHLAVGGEYILHANKGDFTTAESYMPYTLKLAKGKEEEFLPAAGRPTQQAFPYYNIAGDDEGLIYVLSWCGKWQSGILREPDNGLHLKGGQAVTHFKLLPGEEIRSPLAVVLFYAGDWMRGQNQWRRFMVADNLPRREGKRITPFNGMCTGNYFPGLKTNAAGEKFFIDRCLEEGINIDYWVQDAGWYPCNDGWWNVGTWEPDPERFPNGLREVSDYVRAKGVKTIVWFEPERVMPNSKIYQEHPEWLLTAEAYPDGPKLFNLGNEQARKWLTRFIGDIIEKQGIDFYRQDFNIGPENHWLCNDAPDRQGITETKHVMGYYAYWDGLVARFPKLWLDSCASGGNRNDLETMRRAIPLLRSDYVYEPIGQHGHTYGLAMWLPFYGTGHTAIDLYLLRSVYCPGFTLGQDMRDKNLDYDLLRKIFNEWKTISPYFYGDFHPLTEYTLRDDAWIGWQFHDYNVNEGFVQMFRHAASPDQTRNLKFKGLDRNTIYAIQNMDQDQPVLMSGHSLMNEGLSIEINEKPGSALLVYKKVNE